VRVQLWSYNFPPEPTGIAPLSGTLARALAARGHDVDVVAAHPHYPEPRWGAKLVPYREERDGLDVLRLPIWVGRASAFERIRQELSFTTALSLATPALRTPDVIIAASPSFPGLGPAMLNARARRIPWVLRLHDILPDGATATGILSDGALVRAARRFERAAYRSASRIVVISDTFVDNLKGKGVPGDKLVRMYDPASRPILDAPRPPQDVDPRYVLTMGNVGHTQGLVPLVEAFQDSAELAELDARFVMAGDGVAGDDVRRAIRTDRVTITGVLDDEPLERELRRASIAVISQSYDGQDFNVPSKLMNFMGYGIPIVGSVRLGSEVTTLIERAGAGWVTDCRDPRQWTEALATAMRDPAELARRGAAGQRFAREHFAPEAMGRRFEEVLEGVVSGNGNGRG
jgi:putative colanic acid biosynthesis glycosyltransferase WcaI